MNFQLLLSKYWFRIIFVILVSIFLEIFLEIFSIISNISAFYLSPIVFLLLSLFIEAYRKNSKWKYLGFDTSSLEKNNNLIIFYSLVIIFTFFFLIKFLISQEFHDQEFDFNFIMLNMTIYFVYAFYEELLYRGIIFQALIERFSKISVLILMSLFFVLGHSLNPGADFFSLINVFLANVLMSYLYLKSNSIILTTNFHFFWNLFVAFILDSSVSGLYSGPFLWSFGGENELINSLLFADEFGFEGTISTTMILLSLLYITFKYIKTSPQRDADLFKRSYSESKLRISKTN